MKTGILTGVGVGPGNPDLLTLAAIKAIQACDCVLLPNAEKENCYAYRIARQAVPEIDEKEILPMTFPMIRDRAEQERAQEQCFLVIKDRMEQGQNLTFLTIGDPSVYSTYQYIHRRVQKAGMQAKMISGVPSFCAAAARLGISLADMGEEIHIIPAGYDGGGTMEYRGTRIYMKFGRKLAELLAVLRREEEIRAGQGRHLQVYAVSNCGLPDEQVYRGLAEIPDELGYLTIVIVKEMLFKRDHARSDYNLS